MTTSSQFSSEYTLVLGGGGVTGIAWMTGYLLGLQEQGFNKNSFDHVIGTSAGSAVAAQLYGASLEELFQRQIDPELQAKEIDPHFNVEVFMETMASIKTPRSDIVGFCKELGSMAVAAKTVAPERRIEVIKQRLPNHNWPEINLHITVVSTSTGELSTFSKDSGVPLVDAVAASCSVPCIWPPVYINGDYYMDGGAHSPDCATLAKGAKNVLIFSPVGAEAGLSVEPRLPPEVEELEASGSNVVVITPSDAVKDAMGANPLDPSTRDLAAIAGREQAHLEGQKALELFV